MKTIFKIHFSTYLFYLLLILAGYINYLVIYILIITFHELGHLIIIYLLKEDIESITIYPFGGIIKTNINYNINNIKLFLISIGGILFQLLLYLIIDNNEVFYLINTSLIIFNLIPIKPTDGSKILESFLSFFISYKLTQKILIIISFISLFLLFFYNKNIFLFIILYYFNIKFILNFKYILNKFKLERYLYPKTYKRKKYINHEDNIYKEYSNYIKYKNKYLNEVVYFDKKFH